MIGQTISQYTIIEKLGEGGMGVVYKAHDTKLNRDVALKFLPPHIAKGGVERDRFVQEAQTAAGINHPNICVIYEINDSGDQPYIAMEYVDGSTIRTKLESGPMRIDDAIKYGIQIGEALHEAHSKGIVHRDIKADNIIINSKGQAKVMDFGLAKLKGSLKLTRTSSTVGTLGYMAPEQIQGGEVDSRSDIFAFGVLLFEMFTGRLPFRGEHEAAMVYSIVNEDPEPIEKFIPEINPEIIHTLSKALEKDPENRYQSIQDLVVDLRRSKKDSTRVSRPSQKIQYSQSSPSPTTDIQQRSTAVGMKAIGAAGAVTVLLAAAYFFLFSSSVVLNPNMTFRALQIPFTNIKYPGLSSDGNWAAFPVADERGRWDLYFMNTGNSEPRRITYDSNIVIETIDISPDGSKIIYTAVGPRENSIDLMIVAALGGTPRLLAKMVAYPSWEAKGDRIIFLRQLFKKEGGEIWSISPDGKDERLEYVDSVSTRAGARISIDCSPNSREVVYLRTFPDGGYQEIIKVDLDTKKEEQLTFDKNKIDEVCWAPNGQIIFSSNRSGNTNLWMISEEGGEPVQITKGSGPDLGIKISGDNKKLLYYQNQIISDFWTGKTSGEAIRRLTFDDLPKGAPRISPDGQSIAFILSEPDPLRPKMSIQMSDHNGTNRRVLVNASTQINNYHYSPDGRWIVYTEGTNNNSVDMRKTYIVEVARPGSPRFLFDGGSFFWFNNETVVRTKDFRNYLFSLKDSSMKPFFIDSTVAGPVLNGKYVFYRDYRFGFLGRWIVPVDEQFAPKGKPKKVMDPVPFFFTGRTNFLFYMPEKGKLVKVSLPDGKIQRIQGTFPGLTGDFSVSADGKDIVYTEAHAKGKLVMIENPFK